MYQQDFQDLTSSVYQRLQINQKALPEGLYKKQSGQTSNTGNGSGIMENYSKTCRFEKDHSQNSSITLALSQKQVHQLKQFGCKTQDITKRYKEFKDVHLKNQSYSQESQSLKTNSAKKKMRQAVCVEINQNNVVESACQTKSSAYEVVTQDQEQGPKLFSKTSISKRPSKVGEQKKEDSSMSKKMQKVYQEQSIPSSQSKNQNANLQAENFELKLQKKELSDLLEQLLQVTSPIRKLIQEIYNPNQ